MHALTSLTDTWTYNNGIAGGSRFLCLKIVKVVDLRNQTGFLETLKSLLLFNCSRISGSEVDSFQETAPSTAKEVHVTRFLILLSHRALKEGNDARPLINNKSTSFKQPHLLCGSG